MWEMPTGRPIILAIWLKYCKTWELPKTFKDSSCSHYKLRTKTWWVLKTRIMQMGRSSLSQEIKTTSLLIRKMLIRGCSWAKLQIQMQKSIRIGSALVKREMEDSEIKAVSQLLPTKISQFLSILLLTTRKLLKKTNPKRESTGECLLLLEATLQSQKTGWICLWTSARQSKTLPTKISMTTTCVSLG